MNTMTPTWSKHGVDLYLGDCREILPTLGPVDAVITDPPYGVNFAGSHTKHSDKHGQVYESFDDTSENVQTVCVPAVRMAVSLARSAAITPGLRCCHMYDAPIAQGAIFYPSGANAGPWGFVCSQPIYYYGRDPYLLNRLGSRPNGFSSTESAEENGHPCPKPLGQMTWLVNRASLPAETILDPFMGSGTTGVAAVRLGRKFIGIEIEPKYFEIAQRRIEAAMEETSLLDYAQKQEQAELPL